MIAAERAAEAAERGDSATAAYWERIARIVDQAPPLTAAQKSRLRILLRPEPVPESRTAA